jgi:hypothetical protein
MADMSALEAVPLPLNKFPKIPIALFWLQYYHFTKEGWLLRFLIFKSDGNISKHWLQFQSS